MSKFVRKGIVGKSLPEKNGGVEMLTNGKEVGISNSITGKELVFQISLPEEKTALKYHTGRKSGFQISLPEKNCDFKNPNCKIDLTMDTDKEKNYIMENILQLAQIYSSTNTR